VSLRRGDCRRRNAQMSKSCRCCGQGRCQTLWPSPFHTIDGGLYSSGARSHEQEALRAIIHPGSWGFSRHVMRRTCGQVASRFEQRPAHSNVGVHLTPHVDDDIDIFLPDGKPLRSGAPQLATVRDSRADFKHVPRTRVWCVPRLAPITLAPPHKAKIYF
jgi:hypothetical protein